MKVMFSRPCVIPSAHWGVYPNMQWGRGCVSQNGMGQGVFTQRGVSAWRCLPSGCTTPVRHPLRPTSEKATEVGGTHPTGMHSCLYIFLSSTMYVDLLSLSLSK